MYETVLQPSRDLDCSRREIHFLLADGQRITVVAIEGSARKVRLGVNAPKSVKIHAGKLDFQS